MVTKRLLEDGKTQLGALRSALISGEQSGEAEPFDLDEFVADRVRQGEEMTTGTQPPSQTPCRARRWA
ncbi:type II toxin-antitoxin system ParD family antitoxin [Ruania alkalisoli]|uniref:Type II toxin-antitoxin system ParD family antitoxin n=1 Tax=Ruania alkalisoli TaxID=2779775 RepID=A0A7M1SRF4_9MICO|nr:type II toxin-antitoxin system ParD family antitoxin [Ruania alkalisoli]QOR69717.1 type II toxin-antitoxin system ParD family antitoxin [Ruania alkalisoli]